MKSLKFKNTLFLLLTLLVVHSSIAQSKIDEPIKNFEKLWSEFNDRYANFELKKVNWNQVYKKYRSLINEKTTNDSLFEVCSLMINELKDDHVNLIEYKKGKIVKLNENATPTRMLEKFPKSKKKSPNITDLIKVTDLTLQEQGFSEFTKEKKIIKYSTSDQYGYIDIRSMQGIGKGKLKSILNDAIKAFENKKGVIVDVRFNGGGDDKFSYEIAGRFTNQTIVGHRKKTRKKGTEDFTPLKTWYLKPTGDKQFLKPVVLVTSDYSASATDVFALVMKELPNVTIVGDYTRGIFSDMDDFKLPNGWWATLSHQQYFSADMINYEGKGVEPHVEVLNPATDIDNKSDSVMIKALEVLQEKTISSVKKP
ncbi:S41 family peptidase [Aquimarina gracilis]|uniref:S41 family peptidase n=1 Tax=Aquimarina gracilis TaxID=874422 RepID=A0ABU5ZZF1_9FLAO|nr:S41 family peptidase [Aquimarina gracilis]MEB3347212.1 S41 family peptidase [Aquimarina gracilis]